MSLLSTRRSTAPGGVPKPAGVRADLIAGGLALALVAAATAIGFALDVRLSGDRHFPGAPSTFGEWPVLGEWLPHVGPGTPLAVLLAVAAVAWGPGLAQRLPWRTALTAGYLLAVCWTFALALVDGWQRGIAGQLTSRDEYLSAVPGITDIPAMLRTFSDRILDFRPDSLITHVAGHPPGATLTFVWLDRIGLSGGAWAAVVCVLVSGAVAVAVPVTISALGNNDLARAALPFVAMMPGAVWLGVSADGLFAGVTATGIALLATGARALRGLRVSKTHIPGSTRSATAANPASPHQARPGRGRFAGLQDLQTPRFEGLGDLQTSRVWGTVSCLVGGVLLGFGIFLSYGLVLMGSVALAVVWVTRSWRALVWAVSGALSVVAVFAIAGFWWLDGYHLVVERYYQGIARDRPYGYWVWADLACLVLAVGPAAAAGLRRAVPHFGVGLPGRPLTDALPVVALVRGAGLAVLTATVSGLSKAEVERIWLPFAVWLVVAAALLPAASRRGWLAAGAVVALVVNHVLLTNW